MISVFRDVIRLGGDDVPELRSGNSELRFVKYFKIDDVNVVIN
jgi:hypothetical protein